MKFNILIKKNNLKFDIDEVVEIENSLKPSKIKPLSEWELISVSGAPQVSNDPQVN